MVPEGWLRTTLGDIAVVSSGSTPSRTRPEYWGGHIPWVTTSEVNYRPIAETREYVTALALDAVPLRVYPAGTILMAMYGQGVTRGRVAILDIDATINQACCAITLKGDAEPSYVSLLLEFLYPKIRTLGHGGNQQNLNAEIVRQIPIALPPKEEQQRILEILVAWDRAIENLEYQIEAKRARKRGLMQVLLTGKKRFNEFDGLQWDPFRFHELFERVVRKNVEGNQNVLTISGSLGLVSQREYFNRSVSGRDLQGYTLLKRGEFAYNKSTSAGYPFGAIKRLKAHEKGVVSTLYICFRVKRPDMCIDFLEHYFESGVFNRQIYAIAQEGARSHGLLNVGIGDFFATQLWIPSLPEQRRIASVLNAAAKEIELLGERLDAYKLQKRGLMQQLLTGKKRVKASDPETVPA